MLVDGRVDLGNEERALLRSKAFQRLVERVILAAKELSTSKFDYPVLRAGFVSFAPLPAIYSTHQGRGILVRLEAHLSGRNANSAV